jgi:hypothetical protein
VNAPPMSPRPGVRTGQSPPAHAEMKRFRLTLAAIWTVVIMVLCWLPGAAVHRLEYGPWFKMPNFDKLVHAGIFVVFSVLWARVWTSPRRYAWVALGGFGLAILTELVQRFPIVGRDASVADATTDAAGVLLGLVLAPFVEPAARYVESRIAAYRRDA